MADANRRRILGDANENAPERWKWGGSVTPTVDLVLLMYARDEAELARFYGSLSGAFAANGLEQVMRLDTSDLGDHEHFGFRDGISQPLIEDDLGRHARVGAPQYDRERRLTVRQLGAARLARDAVNAGHPEGKTPVPLHQAIERLEC